MAVGAMLVLVAGVGLSLRSPRHVPPPTPPEKIEILATKADYQRHFPATLRSEPKPGADGETNSDFDDIFLPSEKVEEYLNRHHRDAASLLAAYNAVFGTNFEHDLSYLKEAATNYPNDPKVQLSVLAHDVYPEDRRKWLDAFKNSDPSNSLGNYFSAGDYFKNGHPEKAIQELMAAGSKSGFDRYSAEFVLNEEELRQGVGQTPLLARMSSGWGGGTSEELMTLRQVARGIAEVQQQYLSGGDKTSAENLAAMGITAAHRLNEGDESKVVISQLVGNAMESITLQHLDQNTPYDFLGGKTPSERTAELKQQRAELRELSQVVPSTMPDMTEAELFAYTERQRIYGEVAAFRWLRQRHPPEAATPGK